MNDCKTVTLRTFLSLLKGLEAYFNQDYLVALHLLIPQLEEAIRNILEIGNIPTLKPNKSGNGI